MVIFKRKIALSLSSAVMNGSFIQRGSRLVFVFMQKVFILADVSAQKCMEDACQAVHVTSVGQTKMLPVSRRLRRLFVFVIRQTQQRASTQAHTFRLIWCPINAIFSAHQQCWMRNFFNNVLFSCVWVRACVLSESWWDCN